MSIHSNSMLGWVLKSCQSMRNFDRTCLALPDTKDHQALGIDLAAEYPEVDIVYGPENNVHKRMMSAYSDMLEIGANPENPVVRVCADRPFLQSTFIEALYTSSTPNQLFFNHDFADRPGPRGLGAEAIGAELAHELFRGSLRKTASEEHVTLGIYTDFPEKVRPVRPRGTPNWLWSKLRTFDVNTFDDFARACALMKSIQQPQNLLSSHESVDQYA
jgi:spore coat polysaccharide biosynthesis protein SpsF (cytidylyltransferase family)